MKKIFAAIAAAAVVFAFGITASAENMRGDADADNIITANDAARVIENYKKGAEFKEKEDADGNGKRELNDAVEILKKALDSGYELAGDNIIRNNYELTPSNFGENKYFTQKGDFSKTNSEWIRICEANSLSFRVAGGANIYITARHASSTTAGTRTLAITDKDGKTVGSRNYEKDGVAEELLFAVKLDGRYTILANNHINVTSIRIVFGEDIEAPTETTTEQWERPTEITTTDNAVYVNSFDELSAALKSNKKNTDIYIRNDIECRSVITLSEKNAKVNIIGVTKADGTSPRIDFAYVRDRATSSGSGGTGITVNGSGYSFKNIIVENAADCGMRITGSNAGNCFIKDCVFRYNNNSGVSVTSGGHDTVFMCVDSYRNGDIYQKLGADADGFSVKIGAGDNHYFYNCRAWENSDDGWDSYDRGTIVGDIYYVECLAWHNGSPEIFTGEYDYEQGDPLDKKLIYVQKILKNDPDFERKYNNREITQWPNVSVSLLGKTQNYDTIHSDGWGGNPNGFKFGSADTPNTSYRYIENCIAFDHKGNIHQPVAKGYDQNNGYAKFDIVNGLSFDNVQNYWMDRMEPLSVKGTVKGFNGKEADAAKETLTIETPNEDEQNRLREIVHKYRDELYDMVYNDRIQGEKLCNVFE